MWIVSCAELTASKVETMLKLMLYIRASLVPLLNWYNFSALGMLQTRITVPFSEAEASIVPVELIERKEMGDLCACITLATVKVRVEKMRTSPDWGTEVDDDDEDATDDSPCDEEGACGEVGDGTGEGYAR